jgi:hypothetical protein
LKRKLLKEPTEANDEKVTEGPTGAIEEKVIERTNRSN